MNKTGRCELRAWFGIGPATLGACLLLLSAALGTTPASASPSVVAGGHGLDVGLIGARYARRLADGWLSVGVGGGLAGVAPKVALHPLALGTWNLQLSVGALYSPFENVLLSRGALVGFATAGFQRWAYRSEGLGVFVHGAAGVARQFRGEAEGGRIDLDPTVELQLGLSF